MGSPPAARGGGIYCKNSNPSVYNCMIDSCAAGQGGGIYCIDNANPHIKNSSIIGNWAGLGGGIGCSNSDPIIENNIIMGNWAPTGGAGGGIYCYISSSWISYNIICENSSSDGGGVYCNMSDLIIEYNIMYENIAGDGSGIFLEDWSNPVIKNNIFRLNECGAEGGGIYSDDLSTSIIVNNLIIENSSTEGGGIISQWSNDSEIYNNVIIKNSAIWGGGIDLMNDTNTYLANNTICYNSADYLGGGIYRSGAASFYVSSCIIWDNIPEQIYSTNIQATYSNIQYGWPGIGNIEEYPAFVDTSHNDYRLLWGSPCIDSGNPHPQHNDPDGTRADMGAFYYDQSMPVRILLTPHEIPYLIPETGGSMDYTIRFRRSGNYRLVRRHSAGQHCLRASIRTGHCNPGCRDDH